MLARELITEEVLPLKNTDSGSKGLQLMEDLKLTEMPVVNGSNFLGLVSEGSLLDLKDPDQALKDSKLEFHKIYVTEYEHIYEVIGRMAGLNLSLLPVLTDDKQYLGSICLTTLINRISQLGAMKDPGGVLQLEMNVNDYSMAEIANIVESNGAKILSCYIYTHDDSTKMDVTLKINKTDLSAIIQTFERYNYMVVASFHKSEMEDDLKRRYEAFMHYLNM